MTRPKQLGSIPEIPASVDVGTRRLLTAMKEALEVRLGQRGDPLEEAVTKRDLVGSGLARMGAGGQIAKPDTGGAGSGLGVLPPAPVAFQAVGVFGGVVLSWDLPQSAYEGHEHTEVWRSETSAPGSRLLVATAVGSMHFDPIAESGERTWFYWIRFVSRGGKFGAFSPVAEATKPADVAALLEQLSGEIDESALSQSLNERLDASDTAIDEQRNTVSGLSAQYTLRLNVNGYVSGYGMYNDGSTSDFAVVADRFWIAPPNSYSRIKPFIVVNGTTYIDSAMIREASIQAAQIGSVSFGKIVDGAGNPVTVFGGGLKAQYIQTDELWAAITRTQSAFIETASIGFGAIKAANIGDLEVGTLKIAGNAVTIPSFVQAWDVATSLEWTNVLELWVHMDQPGWLYASSTGYIAYSAGWGDTFSCLSIAGQVVSDGGGAASWVSAAHSGGVYVGAGVHPVRLQFRSPSGKGVIVSRSLFAMAVKR